MVSAQLLLLALAGCGPADPSEWSTTVGVWNGSLPDLPQTSAGNLPHSPMLGNGYLGVMLSNNRLAPAISRNSTRGPATPAGSSSNSLHLWLGSNAMWGVLPAASPELGPNRTATRRALGGISLSGLDSLTAGSATTFSAEQQVMQGQLRTLAQSTSGSFVTTTRMDPRANILVLNCSWYPTAAANTKARGGAMVSLNLSAWALSTFPGTPPGQHQPAVVPTTAMLVRGSLVVTREAVPADIASPRRIKAALAAHPSLPLTGTRSLQASDTDPISAAVGTLAVDAAAEFSFSVVVAMVDNLHESAPPPARSINTAALGVAAAQVATTTHPPAVGRAASAWWRAFWQRSFVHLPTEPAIETLWNGAQYILACSASPDVDAATPAPGLGGPFVTSDDCGWNGGERRFPLGSTDC
jgi:hypothetical protein